MFGSATHASDVGLETITSAANILQLPEDLSFEIIDKFKPPDRISVYELRSLLSFNKHFTNIYLRRFSHLIHKPWYQQDLIVAALHMKDWIFCRHILTYIITQPSFATNFRYSR